MENQQGHKNTKWEFVFFPNINLNWIPLTTVLNCAQQERLERRTRVCGSFWRLGARQKEG